VYCRAFLRAYGEFLGLGLEKLLNDFHAQFGLKTQDHLLQEQKQLDEKAFLARRRRIMVVLLMGLLGLAALAVAVWAHLNRKHPQLSRPSAGALPAHSLEPPPGDEEILPGARPFLAVEEGSAPVESSPTQNPGPRDSEPIQSLPEPGVSSTQLQQADQAAFPPSTESVPVVGLDSRVPVGQVFGLKAKGQVWVEVLVDDLLLTRRLLQAGELRYYRAGRSNQVKIGDGSLVGLYERGMVREPLTLSPLFISKLEFPAGELLKKLDQYVASAKEELP
jgi:cytoskeletal protein RodZ